MIKEANKINKLFYFYYKNYIFRDGTVNESDFEMYNLKRKKRSCKSYKGSEDKLIIITSNQNKEELQHF